MPRRQTTGNRRTAPSQEHPTKTLLVFAAFVLAVVAAFLLGAQQSDDKIRKVTIDPKKAQVTGFSSPVAKKNTKAGQVEPQPESVVLSDDQISVSPGVLG